jgi:calcium-dependent protein kinase
LGQGSFGTVYLGIDLRNGQEVAIKVMPKVRGKLTLQRTCEKLLKEASIMAALQDCPGAVRLLGCYESEDEVMVVTELCSGGDLQRLSDEAGALAERGAALVMYEALKVVKCCHDRGVLHGDVKPANFVLKHATRNPLRAPQDLDLLFTPWLRAIDFGCSQYVREERFSKRTGTPVYMAPEVFARDYGLEADVWSAGIMLYQLYARRFPYWETYEACRAARLEEVAALVGAGAIPLDYGPWRRMTPEGLDFVRSCLTHDHVDRMTVDEALDHAWFDAWLPSESDLSASREAGGGGGGGEGAGGGGGGGGGQQPPAAAAAMTPQERLAASHQAQETMKARQRERDSVVLPAFSPPPPSPGAVDAAEAAEAAEAHAAAAAAAAAASSSDSSSAAAAPATPSSDGQQQQQQPPPPPVSGAVARAQASGRARDDDGDGSAAPRPPPPLPRDISTPTPPASPGANGNNGNGAGSTPGMLVGGRPVSSAAAAAAAMAKPRAPAQAPDAAVDHKQTPPPPPAAPPGAAAAEPEAAGSGSGSASASGSASDASSLQAAAGGALRGAWSAAAAAAAAAGRALKAQLEASAAMGGDQHHHGHDGAQPSSASGGPSSGPASGAPPPPEPSPAP